MRTPLVYRKLLPLVGALLIGACADNITTPTKIHLDDPSMLIVDGAHNAGTGGFYFLPPMVQRPSYDGAFDAALSPTVTILDCGTDATCATTSVHATFAGATGPVANTADELYQVNWHAGQTGAGAGNYYRIVVAVGGVELGLADVQMVDNGRQLKNVNTGDYVGLTDNRTLPIKFRVETGIAGSMTITPLDPTIQVGGTQAFTAQLLDLHGVAIAGAPIGWASSDAAVATVDASGNASGVAVGAATISASSGHRSASTSLTVESVAPADVAPVAYEDYNITVAGSPVILTAADGPLSNDDLGSPTATVSLGTVTGPGAATVSLQPDGAFSFTTHVTGTYSIGYTLTNSAGSASSTFTIEVRLSSSAKLVLSPLDSTVAGGTSVQFHAEYVDEYGNRTSASNAIWSVPAGTTALTLSHALGATSTAVTSASITNDVTVPITVTTPNGQGSSTAQLHILAGASGPPDGSGGGGATRH